MSALSVACLTLGVSSLVGQERTRILAGDSVRVDGDFVGRVLSVDGPALTVVSRAVPRCRAGLMHTEAAICDPSPLIRRTMNVDEVVIERRMEKGNVGMRTIVGGLLGAAAFGAAGYLIGPSVGFGQVDACMTTELLCPAEKPRYSPDDLAAKQRSHDQIRGLLFFGVIGGTATAVLAKKLAVGWVRIEPLVAPAADAPLGLGFTVPASR